MGEAEVDYLIRIGEVEKQTGLGRSSVYRRMRDGTFPLALEVGGGQVRWRQSEVSGWLKGLGQVKLRTPAPLPVAEARE
jgi:prophage regulatory protein